MRRAEIRNAVEDPAAIAAALRPDNTDEMRTRVEDGRIVTDIERETTGGLRSTADDYVVNLDVALRTVRHAKRYADRTSDRNTSDPTDNP